MPETVKPIDEVREVIELVHKEVKEIKSDIAVIKNRLYELIREKEAMIKYEEENISQGWGWGFY